MSLDPSRNPPAISEIVGPIDTRLTDVLNAERSKWVSVDASLADPFDALEALIFSGGKRIRPAFFHWAHVGSGGNPHSDIAIDAAAAIEQGHHFGGETARQKTWVEEDGSGEKNVLFEPFMYKNDHFAKTASGQT